MPSSPYTAAADEYLRAGWRGVLRLPRGKKGPPERGFTGYDGRDPDTAKIEAWKRRGGNVALRLPESVLGLDVDAYGDKPGARTWAAAAAELGEPGSTWRSTARHDDPTSGIRFYRVPPGRRWADALGPGVEVVHHGHRYAVVAPSEHPDGPAYGWYDPDGLPVAGYPKVMELPELPSEWIGRLDRGDVADHDHKAELDEAGVEEWLAGLPDGLPGGEPDAAVLAVLDRAEADLAGGRSRHETARDRVLDLVRKGEQGLPGVRAALDTLQAMFLDAAGDDPARDAEGEWSRMLAGAVEIVVERPTPTAEDVFAGLSTSLFTATATLELIRTAAHHRLVSSQALLCYVLARVLAELPPGVVLPPVVGGRASLNLGVAVVGDSGAGKSALLAVSRELLGTVGAWQKDLERNVGSGEGLVQQFLRYNSSTKRNELISDPRRILTVDEIDSLGATQRRTGATIAPTIRSALTGGSLGQANATADRNRHVAAESYRLVMLLGVQPTRSAALLDDADAGTPQRMVWVKATDPTLPDEDVAWPGTLDWQLPGELPDEIDYPEHVRAEIRAARRAQVKGESTDPLAGHKYLTRLKVATALAVLHGDVRITSRWWDLAGLVVAMSSAVQAECQRQLATEQEAARRAAGRLDRIQAEGAAERRSERVVKAGASIARKIAKHAAGAKDGNDQRHEPDDGCTARCISRALRSYPDRDELREQAIHHAAEADWITDRGGRWFAGESRPA